MTGQEAIELIHQKVWAGHKPGLSRTQELLHRVGDPHKRLKFVHITGTNGKGSTASMVCQILVQAGYKAGLFTSPHLYSFHERFRVNGQPISDADLGRITERVFRAGEGMEDSATEFELMTAVGMLYFEEQECDLVVLEVGMGGRLDSTNVIPAPEAAAITNIGLDHTAELGSTRALIAEEKAGIIKPGSHVVLYHQSREVEDVIEEVCRKENVPLILTAPQTLEILSSDKEGQTFRYREKGPYSIGLLGEHQVHNASTAIDIAEVLRQRGWNIPEEALKQGLSLAKWPGRMELVRRDPDVILDGGHNPQCMEALAGSLKKLYPDRKIRFVTGVLADKDFEEMYRQILPLACGFVTITPDSPRAMSAQALAEYLQSQGKDAVPCGTTEEGLKTAFSMAGPEDIVCVCGSLYMMGEVRHLLGLC